MIDRRYDPTFGAHLRLVQEQAEVRGLNESHTDPGWVAPVLTFPARAMDEATAYPIDGDAA